MPADSTAVSTQTLLEAEFELAIASLDRLLAEKSVVPGFPASRIAEARELRDAARELYVDGEYALALAFIDEALKILRE